MKEFFSEFSKRKLKIKPIPSIIIIIFYTFVLTGVMFMMQANGIGDLKVVFKESKGLIILLNYAPLLLINLILFFLFNNLVLSSGIVGAVTVFLSYTNRYMIFSRKDPLMPWDLAAFREGFNILQSMDMKLFIIVFVLIVLTIIFILICMYFIKNTRLKLPIRFGVIVILLLISFFLNGKYYSTRELYESFHVIGSNFDTASAFDSKGFVYSFIYTINTNKLSEFETYNRHVAKNFAQPVAPEVFEELKNQTHPNVFMIMGEAFSDITDNEALNFDNYIDPLHYYKKIRDESISGHIVTPNFGGGTADTEFDVLTGASTRFFRGISYSYRIINRDVNSIAHILNGIGYDNIALSPSHSWFYNRDNVYRFLGFSDYINIDYFTDESMYKSMYVNETATFNAIIEQFENHRKEKDTPFYNFSVTIQNHGPYLNRYMAEKNFDSTIDFTDTEANTLSNYIEGVVDNDRELNNLYEYCKASSEPMVIVFFGDHLPAVERTIFPKLNDSETNDSELNEAVGMFTVPYFIWQNDVSKELNDFESAVKDIKMPKNNIISSNYLNSIFLKLMKLESIDDFTNYALEMLADYPILLEDKYFDENGEFYYYNNIDNTYVEKFKNWQYYKIFDEVLGGN